MLYPAELRAIATQAQVDPAHSFRTLVDDLASIVCNPCRRRGAGGDEPVFEMETKPTDLQKAALDLLAQISP